MSYNTGDKIYAATLPVLHWYWHWDQGNITQSGNVSYYKDNGDIVVTANCCLGYFSGQGFNGGNFGVVSGSYKDTSGVIRSLFTDGDAGGDPSSVSSVSGTNVWIRTNIVADILGYLNRYGWIHIEIYPTYNCPRVYGNKLRIVNSDFSGYEAAGTEKITASLINAGRVCTY